FFCTFEYFTAVGWAKRSVPNNLSQTMLQPRPLARSLSDFGISGCKPTAPVHFSPISWAIVPLFPGEMVEN
ncbi:MAG: hypothetical protein KKG92_07915, partial [Gammaproteobacteria bacterium]|nr:hypothetical protein [Gammaproteobacteria bacterium]